MLISDFTETRFNGFTWIPDGCVLNGLCFSILDAGGLS